MENRKPFLVLKEMYNSYEDPKIVEDENGDVYQRIKILEVVPVDNGENIEEYFTLKYGLRHNNTPDAKFFVVGRLSYFGYCYTDRAKGKIHITFNNIHIDVVNGVHKVYIDIWLKNKNKPDGYSVEPLDLPGIMNTRRGEYLHPEIDFEYFEDSTRASEKLIHVYL